MKYATISTLNSAIEAFTHLFDDEWNIPNIGKIQVDELFRVVIYADNGKWYRYDLITERITEFNNWRH